MVYSVILHNCCCMHEMYASGYYLYDLNHTTGLFMGNVGTDICSKLKIKSDSGNAGSVTHYTTKPKGRGMLLFHFSKFTGTSIPSRGIDITSEGKMFLQIIGFSAATNLQQYSIHQFVSKIVEIVQNNQCIKIDDIWINIAKAFTICKRWHTDPKSHLNGAKYVFTCG